MKSTNLAIVFWPTLMRAEIDDQDMILMRDLPGKLQKIIRIFIDHYEEIFTVAMKLPEQAETSL